MTLSNLLGFVTASTANAVLALPLIQQSRTMAMGGAGVGLADDEYALFQNPAGLAGQEERKFKLIGVNLEGSLETYTSSASTVKAFKNFSASSVNSLIGQDIFVRGGYTPMIKLPHFELAYVADFQGALNGYNLANPTFNLGYQTTQGVQAGMGWKVSPGRHSSEEFRFGVAGKVLWRRGGYYTVNTAGFLAAANNGQAYLNNLVGSYGMGIGGDAGLQYVKHISKDSQFSAGASATDIGGTKFSDPHAAPIPSTWNLGLGYKRDLHFLKMAFDFDVRNLTDETAFSNKLHFGSEWSIPLFKFYLGLNQMNFTYGVAVDIWILKVTLLSYGEELAAYYHQNFSRRYMLSIDFNLPI